jgi:hypothetical protein
MGTIYPVRIENILDDIVNWTVIREIVSLSVCVRKLFGAVDMFPVQVGAATDRVE